MKTFNFHELFQRIFNYFSCLWAMVLGSVLLAVSAHAASQPPLPKGTNSCAGYTSPGKATIDCAFFNPDPTRATLVSLVCLPKMPSGWNITSVSGDSQPSISGKSIVFAGPFSGNVTCHITVSVPSGQSSTASLSTDFQFKFSGMSSAMTITCDPNPLVVKSTTTTQAPRITSQPNSLSVTEGANATFKVAATGTPSPTYQWYKDGTALRSSTRMQGVYSATLTITGAQTADAGNYTVLVQNSAGSVESQTAALTVQVPTQAPKITSQPTSLSIKEGANATFQVAATGTPVPTYQWYKDGTALRSSTRMQGVYSATLTITGAQTADAGNYTVLVQNSAGSVESQTAALTVQVPTQAPKITSQPTSLSIKEGANASFQVAATGTPVPTYQWYKDGTALRSSTRMQGVYSATLTITGAQTADAGNYTVLVQNSAGSVESQTAALTVQVPTQAPKITSQPTSLSIKEGANASFQVVATGTPSPTYQWYKDGTALRSSTRMQGVYSATLTITGAQTADAGNYTVVVQNSAGSVQSQKAALNVESTSVGVLTTISVDSEVRLSISGATNHLLEIQAAPTPTGPWTTVALPFVTGSPFIWVDTQTPTASRFYRVAVY